MPIVTQLEAEPRFQPRSVASPSVLSPDLQAPAASSISVLTVPVPGGGQGAERGLGLSSRGVASALGAPSAWLVLFVYEPSGCPGSWASPLGSRCPCSAWGAHPPPHPSGKPRTHRVSFGPASPRPLNGAVAAGHCPRRGAAHVTRRQLGGRPAGRGCSGSCGGPLFPRYKPLPRAWSSLGLVPASVLSPMRQPAAPTAALALPPACAPKISLFSRLLALRDLGFGSCAGACGVSWLHLGAVSCRAGLGGHACPATCREPSAHLAAAGGRGGRSQLDSRWGGRRPRRGEARSRGCRELLGVGP